MPNLETRILAMAAEMTGDQQSAAVWFKQQPIPGWAGKLLTILSARTRPTRCLTTWRPCALAFILDCGRRELTS